jgi:hypothetical protein
MAGPAIVPIIAPGYHIMSMYCTYLYIKRTFSLRPALPFAHPVSSSTSSSYNEAKDRGASHLSVRTHRCAGGTYDCRAQREGSIKATSAPGLAFLPDTTACISLICTEHAWNVRRTFDA